MESDVSEEIRIGPLLRHMPGNPADPWLIASHLRMR